MDKIYVVRCEKGDWEDYVSWNGGIWTNLKDAEDHRDALNRYAKIIRENCPPDPSEDDSITGNSEDYWDYYTRNKKWLSGFEATVQEVQINIQLEVVPKGY